MDNQPPLCAGFEHDKDIITIQTDYWYLKFFLTRPEALQERKSTGPSLSGAIHSMSVIDRMCKNWNERFSFQYRFAFVGNLHLFVAVINAFPIVS